MNADLQKLRDSRLFKKLPDRAFDRVLKYIKIRSYDRGEEVIRPSSSGEFSKYFGYVLRGRVIYLTKESKPVGMSFTDELFVGRSFTIEEQAVSRIVSGAEHCLVVFIPREIIGTLSSASRNFSEIIEEIYEAIFERAEMISQDAKGAQHFDEWLKDDGHKTLTGWLSELERKKQLSEEKKKKDKQDRRYEHVLWLLGCAAFLLAAWEAAARIYLWPYSPTQLFTGELGPYDKQADFNIWMGIIGYGLLLFTNLHTFVKMAIRRFKWKLNFKHSSQLHIFFGILGGLLVLIHTAGHLRGQNVAHYAVYFMTVVLISGLVGQIISSRIPRTISGDKMKLNNILKEQDKLKKKAELLMDDQQFKTSLDLMARPLPKSFWINLFSAPLLWFRAQKIKKALRGLGLGAEAAGLAASLLAKEFELRQKIRSLEVANIFFKRWMWIHIPMAYLLYLTGAIHIFLVFYQGLLDKFLGVISG